MKMKYCLLLFLAACGPLRVDNENWSFSVSRDEYPDMNPGQVAATLIRSYRLCPSGWEITQKSETEDRLSIKGRCL